MMTFAVSDDRFDVTENPVKDVPRRKMRKTIGHKPWPLEYRQAFRAYWQVGSEQRLAFEIFNWVGARCCDTRTLGRQMIDPVGWLCFDQQKTGVAVEIPFTGPLPEWCEDFAEDHAQLFACLEVAQGRMTFILTEKGAPRSEKGISQWFAAAAREAGVPMGYAAHGLRMGWRLPRSVGRSTRSCHGWDT